MGGKREAEEGWREVRGMEETQAARQPHLLSLWEDNESGYTHCTIVEWNPCCLVTNPALPNGSYAKNAVI